MGLLRLSIQRERLRTEITLFVHLITSKIATFQSIAEGNSDFQITSGQTHQLEGTLT